MIDDDGYYDPQALEALAAGVPIVSEGLALGRRGVSKGLAVTRKLARTQTINLGIKLGLVAGLWGVGIYVLWMWQKSGLKAITDTYGLPIITSLLSPVVGLYMMLSNIGGYLDKIFGGMSAEGKAKAENDITAFIAEMQSYIVIWSIICVLIGLYVVYQHRTAREALVIA